MHTTHTRWIALAVAGVLAFASPAFAVFTVTPNGDADDLFNALVGNVTGLSNFDVTLNGAPVSFGLFNGDPFGLGGGVALSTGLVAELPGRNSLDGGDQWVYPHMPNDLSTDLGGTRDQDLAELVIRFDAAPDADRLFFRYVFGSEEFREFGGSQFNDEMEMRLNGHNFARLTDGQLVKINNLVPDPLGPFHVDYVPNPAGPDTLTRLDGYTVPLLFEGTLLPGERNELIIAVRDITDGAMDSALFIGAGTLSVNQSADYATAPEPATLLLAAMGVGLLVTRRRR